MSTHNEFGTGVGLLMKITIGPWIWAFHFVISYGGAAIWCEKLTTNGDIGTLQLALIALTVVAVAGIAATGIIGWRNWSAGGGKRAGTEPGMGTDESRNRFLGQVSVLLSVVSAIGVVLMILPILMFGTCQ